MLVVCAMLSLPLCRTFLWNLSPELAAGAERRIQLSESDELSDQARWSQPAEVQGAHSPCVGSCRLVWHAVRNAS